MTLLHVLLKIAPDEQQSGTFFLFISPYAVGLGGIVKCDRMGVVPEDRLDKQRVLFHIKIEADRAGIGDVVL